MRVMCVKRGAWRSKDNILFDGIDMPGPKYGEECEVIEIVDDGRHKFYALYGWKYRYNVDAFIPLLGSGNTERSLNQLKNVIYAENG